LAATAPALAARDFADAASARDFLEPAPEKLHDPFGMAGLPEAVERLADSARRGARVVVFGDYDCDGVGALAILTPVLARLGADARPFIPHRVADGYGLRAETLRRVLAEHRPEGIVTVDCGITARDPVEEALRAGVYVIVTDHHLPPERLPEGALLVDPKLPGCPSPFKELCGAGIAWKLAEALLARAGGSAGLSRAACEAWRASLAKIAAIATVADVVPLTGENRILVSWGLSGLAEPRAPGLTALMNRAGIPPGRGPTAREVAFRIAPRLNAAGRLDHARRALELLTTSDPARAEALADELEAANAERRAVQERLVETVLERLAGSFVPERDAVVVEAGEAGEGWHRGVLGLAASRVAERVRRPVLLFARDGDRVQGSGRTWGTTPLFARVAPVAGRFASEFGGHDAALGVTVPAARWDVFRETLREAFAAARDDAEWEAGTVADAELPAAEVTEELAGCLARFEPHGAGNPRPVFRLRGLSWDGRGRRIGPRGLRTAFNCGDARLDAVGWTLADLPEASRPGRADLAAHVVLDAYTARPTLEVVALEPAAP
ncbi:MAG TPA: single-stranded-DNA-specific exonuclease RecJ, partial [Thermoanaerobaculia bacterium]|nr:single-stranded-DNA-specific exonuclease RecJ [Thermoanaerobaculia bacterium]